MPARIPACQRRGWGQRPCPLAFPPGSSAGLVGEPRAEANEKQTKFGIREGERVPGCWRSVGGGRAWPPSPRAPPRRPPPCPDRSRPRCSSWSASPGTAAPRGSSARPPPPGPSSSPPPPPQPVRTPPSSPPPPALAWARSLATCLQRSSASAAWAWRS